MIINFLRALTSLLLFLSAVINAQPTIEEFIREPDYLMAAVSPNGQYLAEVWNRHVDNKRFVTIRDLSQPEKPIVGQHGDRIVRPKSVSWASNKRLIIDIDIPQFSGSARQNAKKDEDFNIYDYAAFSRTIAIDVDGSNSVLLLEDQKQMSINIRPTSVKHYLPNDPDHILMTATAGFSSNLITQFKVNVHTGKSEKIVSGTKFTYAFLNDENGKPLYRLDRKYIAKSIEIFQLKDDDWSFVDQIELDTVEEFELAVRENLIGLYKGNLVYRKKNEETGHLELWSFNGDTKEYKLFVSEKNRDILYLVPNLLMDEVIGYVIDGDVISHRFFDQAEQMRYDKLVAHFDNYNLYFESQTSDGNLTVVRTSRPDNPSSYSLYNFKDNSLSPLQSSHFPLKEQNLSIPAKVQIKARDGLIINTYILLPKDFSTNKSYPMVVLPHGGPHVRDRANFDIFAQFVSTRGYIVIKPNFRGSTGYGKAFEEAGYKEWGGKMQEDLEDATRFMVEKGYADPEKICIVGFSYGGYAALMGVINDPGMYQCAISLNGVTDLPDIIQHDTSNVLTKEVASKYLNKTIGNPNVELAKLKAKSPVWQVDKIQVPILIVGGMEDDVVPFPQTKRFTKTLKKHKKQFEFLELENAGHNPIRYAKDAKEVFTTVEKFLAQYLQ